MDYSVSPEFALQRLGLEVLKVQGLERHVQVLETALRIATGTLELGEEGIDMNLMNEAAALLDRFKSAGTPDPEEAP